MATREQLKELEETAPYGACRVRVRDTAGKLRWRLLPGVAGDTKHKILDTDEFARNLDKSLSYMKNQPGNRHVKDRMPIDEFARAIVRDKAEHFKHDPLMQAVEKNPESTDVLYATIRAVATECSSLEFERHEKERLGEDTTMISARRIAALTKIGDTWLKRIDQVMAKGLDLQSPAFQAVFSLILETMRESLVGADVPLDRIQLAFTKFSQRVEDDMWTHEAKAKMRAVT